MALRTGKSEYIPEGSVRLTRDEALAHQKVIIRDWPRDTEVAFLRYGCHISGVTTLTTSFILIKHFRDYLRVGLRSQLFAFTPTVIIPSFVSYYMTDKILTDDTLLMKLDCPICRQLKFAGTQFYVGVAFPAVFSYFSYANTVYATNCYPLPQINTHAREFWQATFKIFKNSATKFYVTGLIQSLLVLSLPNLQSMQLFNVMEKLKQAELKRDS